MIEMENGYYDILINYRSAATVQSLSNAEDITVQISIIADFLRDKESRIR